MTQHPRPDENPPPKDPTPRQDDEVSTEELIYKLESKNPTYCVPRNIIASRLSQLQAENERLRKALEKILHKSIYGDDEENDIYEIQGIAQQALTELEED